RRKDFRCCASAFTARTLRRSCPRGRRHSSRQRHSSPPRRSLRARSHPPRRMMPDVRTSNRTMFWRIIRRFFGANPGRLFVILLALEAGATVTAALLNLQVDAKRRLTTEFRSFGPNIVIAPHELPGSTNSTLDQSVGQQVPSDLEGQHVGVLAVLYVATDVLGPESQTPTLAVVAGESGDYLDAEITPGKSSSRNRGVLVS